MTLYDLLEWKAVEEKVAKKKLNNISMIRTFDLLMSALLLRYNHGPLSKL